jgi:hypothetical protein
MPCDVITACCVATHDAARLDSARLGTEKTPLSLLLRGVYSVARRLAVGYLTTLSCVIQQWVDMSQYVFNLNRSVTFSRGIFGIASTLLIVKECDFV